MFEVRKAVPADLPAVVAYYNAHISVLDREKYKVQWQTGAYPSEAYLKGCIEAGELWVGTFGGAVVAGMVLNHRCNEGYGRVNWNTEDALVLHTLGVHPDYGGRGFAKQMLRRAMAYALECGEPAIRLDVRRGNDPARGLYEKLGFRYVQTEKMYYADMGWGEFDCFEWLADAEELIEKEDTNMRDFLELARARYSVRKYKREQIEKDVLDRILEAGNVAPTGVNYQPQRIYVLQSAEALAKAKALSPCTFDAPTVLLFAYDDDQDWDNPKQAGIHSGEQDVSIVATHIMLAAWSLGVASCWVNLFPNDAVHEAFNLPENEKVVLMMPLGYAADDARPAKWHDACKPIGETVSYL